MVLRKVKDKYKIVAIYGSPRMGGNTATLMDYFLKGILDNDSYRKDRVDIENNSFKG